MDALAVILEFHHVNSYYKMCCLPVEGWFAVFLKGIRIEAGTTHVNLRGKHSRSSPVGASFSRLFAFIAYITSRGTSTSTTTSRTLAIAIRPLDVLHRVVAITVTATSLSIQILKFFLNVDFLIRQQHVYYLTKLLVPLTKSAWISRWLL